jgi:hypothetical protein
MDSKQMQKILRQAQVIDNKVEDLARQLKAINNEFKKLGREIENIGDSTLEDDIYDSFSRVYQALNECYNEIDMATVQDNIQECFDDYIEYNEIDV